MLPKAEELAGDNTCQISKALSSNQEELLLALWSAVFKEFIMRVERQDLHTQGKITQ